MITRYECEDCGKIFDEPDERTICLEAENGVGSLFSDCHYTTALCCPYCNAIEIEEIHDYSDEEGEENE